MTVREQAEAASGARLSWSGARRHPDGVVLVLHGGRVDGRERPRWHDLNVLRMVPFSAALARVGGGRLAVASIRYAARGWNTSGAPVRDARWALSEIARRWPGAPVAVVGYSMGGRVALLLAGDPGVRVVVGLAPWADEQDVPSWRAAPGLQMLLLHGTADRVTDPHSSEVAARRFTELGASVEHQRVDGGTHTMLQQPRWWHRRVADFVGQTLGAGHDTPP